MTLEELLPDEDYRFQFKFAREDPREFFGATSQHAALLAQRRYWFQSDPAKYAALLPAGRPLLDETIELAHAWGLPAIEFSTASAGQQQDRSTCAALGSALEPDLLLLKVEGDGVPHLQGGAICFPSSWSLEEKLGKPIVAIHAVVPGLNVALGSQIGAFLTKLRPGIAWLRSNWGLSRTAELNQHPGRGLARLDSTVQLDEVWLRIENQALVALPRTNGILFGIRIANHPLRMICSNELLSMRLARAVRTMPEEVAVYKGLAGARDRLCAFLKS